VAVPRFLSVICFSHRNDVPGFTAFRPNHNHHSASKKPGGDDPRFSVVLPVIDLIDRGTREYVRGIEKVDPAVFERCFPLLWIERDLHYLCTHNN
jgi:hypothetical protein